MAWRSTISRRTKKSNKRFDLDLVWSDLNGYLHDVQRALLAELALLKMPNEDER
jgi:hypothetical protein